MVIEELHLTKESSSPEIKGEDPAHQFCDSECMLHKRFVPQGVTVNGLYYMGVMEHLLKCIHHVSQNLIAFGDWHDKAPTHSALIMKLFLDEKIDHSARTSSFFWQIWPMQIHIFS